MTSCGLERGNGLQDFHLFVAQGLAVQSRRRLHRQIAQHLEEVVLDDVANGARRVVEGAAALDAEVLRHRDLHALDVSPIPERLQDRIREASEQHVVNGPLSEVVVDPEDVRLDERAEQDPVQLARRRKVLAEGLLDDDAGPFRASGLSQLLHDGAEERGRDRQVVRGVLGAVRARVAAPRTSPGPCSPRRRTEAARTACRTRHWSRPPYFSTLSCARARNWSSVQPALATPMTGTLRSPRLAIACSAGKIFLYARSPVAPKNTSASECVSPISIPVLSTLKQSLRASSRHFVCSLLQVSAELKRIAESSWFWNRFAARAEAREERGGQHRRRHASSIAAVIVQRPSPESDTRPPNFAQDGILEQRRGREVQQPRSDDAATAPHLGDVGEVDVVLVVRGIAERRRLGVHLVRSLADVGGSQDAHALGVRRHQAVLDAVVRPS